MGKTLMRNKELPTFFGEVQLRGERQLSVVSQKETEKLSLFYQHPHGQLWKGDSIEWLKINESRKC